MYTIYSSLEKVSNIHSSALANLLRTCFRMTGLCNSLGYIQTPNIYILPWSIWSGEILETTFIVDGMKAM